MSREIKFRAYVKDIDQLDENEIPHKGNFIYGNLARGDEYDFITSSMHMLSDGYTNFTWQWMIKKGSAEQFTGLKDKTGKEIYEGDVVHGYDQEPDRDDGYVGSSVVEVVNFKWGSFWLGDFKNRIMLYIPPIIEVIGNVHENPDYWRQTNER